MLPLLAGYVKGDEKYRNRLLLSRDLATAMNQNES